MIALACGNLAVAPVHPGKVKLSRRPMMEEVLKQSKSKKRWQTGISWPIILQKRGVKIGKFLLGVKRAGIDTPMVVKGCCPFFGIQMDKKRWYCCSPGRCHSQIGHWKFMTLRNKLVPSFHTNLTWLWHVWNPFKSSIYFSNSVCTWPFPGFISAVQKSKKEVLFLWSPPQELLLANHHFQCPPLSSDHQKQTKSCSTDSTMLPKTVMPMKAQPRSRILTCQGCATVDAPLFLQNVQLCLKKARKPETHPFYIIYPDKGIVPSKPCWWFETAIGSIPTRCCQSFLFMTSYEDQRQSEIKTSDCHPLGPDIAWSRW